MTKKILAISVVGIVVIGIFIIYEYRPLSEEKLRIHCEYDNQYLIKLSYTYYRDRSGNEVKHGMLYKRTPSPWGDMYRPIKDHWELYHHGILVDRKEPPHAHVEPFEAFMKKPTICKCESH
jgi:hypothetical protein